MIIRSRVSVVGVHEHIRTIRGRKNDLGEAVLDSVSLGWFIHLDFDHDGIGEISVGVGPSQPDVAIGDILIFSLEREPATEEQTSK